MLLTLIKKNFFHIYHNLMLREFTWYWSEVSYFMNSDVITGTYNTICWPEKVKVSFLIDLSLSLSFVSAEPTERLGKDWGRKD